MNAQHIELPYYQEWGTGDPVIALHPLALESTAFAGVARVLAARGLRTLAVDLPGFGRTPAPAGPLTPARLAEPVVELARSLESPPIILGMSMGGRVALEAALQHPRIFRGVVMVAPYLPWRRFRWAMPAARFLDPAWAERLPLEKIWPLLKSVAEAIEAQPRFDHDWFARACVRVVYYSSCAATRASFISAARELALDPAFGEQGVWTRLARLKVPTAFLWAGRDGLIPADHAEHAASALPRSHRLEVPCSAHFVNGEHFRCLEHAIAMAVTAVSEGAGHRRRQARKHTLTPCLADVPMAVGDELPEPPHRASEMA
ncbi:MAG: alpha/beta fold hydrolase [Deltaproteobacteria bacterium]|nr:alpha/beta fold hydrolase [Deltaproteobacteria bacterium]MBW2393319.1 alpha/beta fold hydrolase [Deltaproteobacteria bacterium]